MKLDHAISEISDKDIKKMRRILEDNGIRNEKSEEVLRAIGYALFDMDICPESREYTRTFNKSDFCSLFEETARMGKLLAISPSLAHFLINGTIQTFSIRMFDEALAARLNAKEITDIVLDTENDPVCVHIMYVK